MLKQQLPKDWIELNSKTHPDRVYYFNVKTKKSSWSVPTLDITNKTSEVKRRATNKRWNHNDMTKVVHNDEKEQKHTTQQVSKKSPVKVQVKHRQDRKNKSLSPPPETIKNTKQITSPNHSSNLRDNISVTSRHKECVALTPQMKLLLQKKLESVPKALSFNKKNSKEDGNIKGRQEKLPLKKNLAKERMQRLKKNLAIDNEKLKEMYCANLVDVKTSQKSLSSASTLSDNESLDSTFTCKNTERLKKLHNKILKNAVYEKKIALNEELPNQQNTECTENMTTSKLLELAKKEVFYEEMDWEPMKDEEIALEVEVARTQLYKSQIETNCALENVIELTQPNEIKSHDKNPLYIVIDTNVFLTNLDIIEEARDAIFKNYPRPFIVIPWTVICELDYFKDNKSKIELSTKARKAVSFIYDQFSSKHPRVIGQTREQAAQNKEDFCLNCPDDEILQCCLQIQRLEKTVVLLSYDKNLCTKAMIYNIMTLGRNSPLENIDSDTNNTAINNLNNNPDEYSLFNEELHLTDEIFENMKLIIKKFLSTIITKQMSEIYGEREWTIYVFIKPPWTIISALKCAIKHWIAAINEAFEKRAEHILKELLKAFEYVPTGGRKLQDVEYILDKCSDLVQAVNTDKHCDLMTETLNSIIELKEKCQKCITNINLKKLHDKIGIAENIHEQQVRAEKVFESFQCIYNYARDICGLACNNAGIAHSFSFKTTNRSLSQQALQSRQSEITSKVIDLTQNLNKLLSENEDFIKYQTLLKLQHSLNTFLPSIESLTLDVTPLDVYYCVKLKEDLLKAGLKQLQELTSHFCAAVTQT